MIYIDPPYNTGSDSFIYPDKFSETREEYARRVGDKDSDGYLKRDGVFQGAWRKNPRENGHYHSNWLSMMLPRLHLARTLLRDDGVIFISIDDNEQAQLKLLCDEVFGAENFVSNLIWEKKYRPQNDAVNFSESHDFILCYAKNKKQSKNDSGWARKLLPRSEAAISGYSNPDNDPRGAWVSSGLMIEGSTPNCIYTITGPTGIEFNPTLGKRWSISKDTFEKLSKENRIWYGVNGTAAPRVKRYITEVQDGVVPSTILFYKDVGHTGKGKKDFINLMNSECFSYPKPTLLIKHLLLVSNFKNDDLALDFFSGSGTTAHAVMQLNAEDGGKRRYLCVQLPEDLNISLTQAASSEAKRTIQNAIDFLDSINKERTIAEIAKERIRRAGAAILGSLKDGQSVDTGFKVFKLSESSFKQWRQPENIADLGTTMEMFVNAVQDNAAPENMLYELMLRLGCKLTSPIEHKNGVYWVTDEDTGKRIALLLEAANQTLIDEVIAAAPAKVVALDKWFDGNDALKSNTVLQMKDAGIVFECV